MCNVLSEFVFVYTYYNYNTFIIPMFYDFRYSSKRKEADRSFALKFAGGGRSLGDLIRRCATSRAVLAL